jgi:hypothetical protein
VIERVLLESDDLGEARSEQQLHVEDFLDGGLKLQEGDVLACAEVDHSDAAEELVARSDVAVYRPSTGSWYYLHSSTNNASYTKIDWGLSGDTPVPGDYLGTGYSQIVVYRPGSPSRWYIRGGPYIDFGMTGDIPTPADFDGDGRMDIAVFRPSTHIWYIKLSSREFASYITSDWGATGDVPTAADYDGDGKADLATWRPGDGMWRIAYSSTGFASGLTVLFGNNASDIPVPGDYNRDGRADIAVWRPSLGRFYIRDLYSKDWGLSTDVPVLKR